MVSHFISFSGVMLENCVAAIFRYRKFSRPVGLTATPTLRPIGSARARRELAGISWAPVVWARAAGGLTANSARPVIPARPAARERRTRTWVLLCVGTRV